MRNGYGTLPPQEAAKELFESMFSPAIVMLLAGFTLAAALTKHDISRRAATFVLSRAGTHPATILLACMGIATFSSMWITNVAAPPLCFSVIQVETYESTQYLYDLLIIIY